MWGSSFWKSKNVVLASDWLIMRVLQYFSSWQKEERVASKAEAAHAQEKPECGARIATYFHKN